MQPNYLAKTVKAKNVAKMTVLRVFKTNYINFYLSILAGRRASTENRIVPSTYLVLTCHVTHLLMIDWLSNHQSFSRLAGTKEDSKKLKSLVSQRPPYGFRVVSQLFLRNQNKPLSNNCIVWTSLIKQV